MVLVNDHLLMTKIFENQSLYTPAWSSGTVSEKNENLNNQRNLILIL